MKDTDEEPDDTVHRMRSGRVASTGPSVPVGGGVWHPLIIALFTSMETL